MTINSDFFKGIKNFSENFPELVNQKFLVYGGAEKYKRLETQVLGWSSVGDILSE